MHGCWQKHAELSAWMLILRRVCRPADRIFMVKTSLFRIPRLLYKRLPTCVKARHDSVASGMGAYKDSTIVVRGHTFNIAYCGHACVQSRCMSSIIQAFMKVKAVECRTIGVRVGNMRYIISVQVSVLSLTVRHPPRSATTCRRSGNRHHPRMHAVLSCGTASP